MFSSLRNQCPQREFRKSKVSAVLSYPHREPRIDLHVVLIKLMIPNIPTIWGMGYIQLICLCSKKRELNSDCWRWHCDNKDTDVRIVLLSHFKRDTQSWNMSWKFIYIIYGICHSHYQNILFKADFCIYELFISSSIGLFNFSLRWLTAMVSCRV